MRAAILVSLLVSFSCRVPGEAPARHGGPSVGVLLLDGVYNSELMAPYDVFHHTVFHTERGMRVFTVGRSKAPVRSFEGLRIEPDHDFDTAPEIDVLLVPSSEQNMTSDLDDTRLLSWLSERGQKARWVMSVCDGAFLLAKAGLLEGRSCTTFPADIRELRRLFPDLDVRDGPSFVVDGGAITGVGGARSYEPAMYLVEKLYGDKVAERVGRGLVLDWSLAAIDHVVVRDREGERPSCYLPGERIDAGVTVENAEGRKLKLGDLVSAADRAVLLCILSGAEAKDVAKRGGLWCEDSYSELQALRHLLLDYEPKGVRFIAVACPPVHHEERFGYAKGGFLEAGPEDPLYKRMRRRFVDATLALRDNDVLPFEDLYFDPRFRLLGSRTPGAPIWQGRFKWHEDTQTYGTPTLWILSRNPDRGDLEVYGEPFHMNVYESEGRRIRYTVRDIKARLDRLLDG